jgi:autotransporter-associated beta strand protein
VAALGGGNTGGTFTLSGGTIEALIDYDLGHTWTTSTTVGSITFDKLNGQTTTINGPVTLNVTSGATLSLYKLASNTNSSSVVTKTGNGTLKLMGGTPSGSWIGNWQINAGTLYVNTTSSGALGTNNAVVMNGGNLLFSKGVGSSGTYSGHGQDTALSVLAETTVTLDPNAATLASNNTVSFTNLSVGTQTIHVTKGVNTKSSATDSSYTDPQLTFKTATLTGQTTLDVAANVETVMQAGSGTGGVTKNGVGKLSLSSNPSIYAATATTILNGDAVSGFTLTYAGNPSVPYQSAPTVTISAPASGTQATATATIANGLVTGLTIVNPGSGYTVAPTVTIAGPGVPNSFSGPTTVNSGTLVLSGNNASSITIGSSGVLEMALVTSNSPTTTRSLIFNGGAKVRPVGTPTESVYTLITAGDGITGTPILETSIQGYVLAVEGNSLVLRQQVAKVTPTIIVTPSVGGYVYSGSIQGPGVSEVNKGGSTGGVTLSYAGTGSTTYGPSATPPINAGTYSLTATVASDSLNNEASSIPTAFTIAKANPTVSVAPTASAVTVGAQLSTSNLSGGTASAEGTYAWTAPSTVVSSSGSYPVTFNPTDGTNYNTASTSANVTANPAGTTYSGWLSGGTASDAAFLDYVFGATTPGALDASLKPTVAVTGGNLVLTYNVRQGTVGLTVTAQTSSDLAAGAAGWGTSGVTDVAVGTPRTVNGVSVQQRTASVPVSGGKKFLQVKAVQN